MSREQSNPIAHVLETPVRFTDAILTATKAYAAAKPWRGTIDERIEKLSTYHAAMCEACDVSAVLNVETDTLTDESGASCNSAVRREDEDEHFQFTIAIRGKLSVVTYLHLFGLCMGYNPAEAMRFRVHLFKTCFPLSFAACEQNPLGLLIR